MTILVKVQTKTLKRFQSSGVTHRIRAKGLIIALALSLIQSQ